MRITILQGAFLPVPPLRGGAVEKMWFELGKQFSKKGHRVCHVSRRFPGLPQEELIEGVHHLRVKGYHTPANGLHLKLLDLLYSLRALRVLPPADILITNSFWLPILAARRQQRFGQIVVDVARMPKGQMRFYRRAACLRANSSAVAQAIAQEAPHLSGLVCTIPNPLPFQPPQLSAAGREPVILYCGRLHPEKGIALLLEAFRLACERGLSGWTLRLVGPADTAAGGGGLSWLEGLLAGSKAVGLPIQWIGPVYGEQELLRLYQQAALFAYPSLAERGETFGLAPLEAMACGAVPIVSDLACFRDFITSGLNGLAFNHRSLDPASQLAQEIINLAHNPDRRAAMAEAALDVRNSHHPATIARQFIECFQMLI
ncbi:glycosyltransferase family 4 protein [Synechococcus sp. HK05]|uniref:glycosyltransferase family 4 protein n=1 Tax=Synechococcus sp. HK05 TaxID=2725975 RepID=UPI001C390AA1|nr:glycosyltransferase family 4 protein [Synechococcus sp. HK05]MBV2350350.1 glycosyltransferase family 4 protein [Synechococcus sp. HK05]